MITDARDGLALRRAWLDDGDVKSLGPLRDWLADAGVEDPVLLTQVWEKQKVARGCGMFMYSCGEFSTGYEDLAQTGCDNCKAWAVLKLAEKRLIAGTVLEATFR